MLVARVTVKLSVAVIFTYVELLLEGDGGLSTEALYLANAGVQHLLKRGV